MIELIGVPEDELIVDIFTLVLSFLLRFSQFMDLLLVTIKFRERDVPRLFLLFIDFEELMGRFNGTLTFNLFEFS